LVLDSRRLAALPDDVGLAALRLALARAGHRGPLRGPAMRALARLLVAPPARPVRVGGLRVERSGRRLRVARAPAAPLEARRWDGEGELALPEVELVLRGQRRGRPAGWTPPRDPRVAVFDADRVPGTVLVRARRTGDRVAPLGGPEWRRLKTLLIDAAVPRWERARVPILEADGDILWVAGVRRGRAAAVTDATTRLWEVALARAVAPGGGAAAESVSER
jgi:tRNA(Ile)-lysidine synthetase-like protein